MSQVFIFWQGGRYDGDSVTGNVSHQRAALAIADHTSGRVNGDQPKAVGISLQLVALRVQDLQAPQLDGQHGKSSKDQDLKENDSELGIRGIHRLFSSHAGAANAWPSMLGT